MKHIPIKYHFLREQVAKKNIRVEYVGTKEQVADIFTKPLPRESFEYGSKFSKTKCVGYSIVSYSIFVIVSYQFNKYSMRGMLYKVTL
jgi:hypothetical protein